MSIWVGMCAHVDNSTLLFLHICTFVESVSLSAWMWTYQITIQWFCCYCFFFSRYFSYYGSVMCEWMGGFFFVVSVRCEVCARDWPIPDSSGIKELIKLVATIVKFRSSTSNHLETETKLIKIRNGFKSKDWFICYQFNSAMFSIFRWNKTHVRIVFFSLLFTVMNPNWLYCGQ